MKAIQLILLRHGQPQLQNALLGSTDSELTSLGWRQLENSCRALVDIDLVVTSPLARCRLFAIEFAKNTALKLVCDSDWQEYDFGDWDGIGYQLLQKQHGEKFSAFLDNPSENAPPNGELLDAFNQRIDRAMNHLIRQHMGKKILLITHGGVIRSLVAWCMNMDRLANSAFQRIAVEYASISQIDIYHGEKNLPQLVKLNHSLQDSAE